MDTMGTLRRTHYCADSANAAIGEEIVAAGFIAKARDLGNLIFADLRDRTGILQLAFDDGTDRAVFEKAKSLRSEYVVLAKGVVRERQSKNANIATGNIELYVNELRVLSAAETTPFEIRDEVPVREDLALTYRYLELRKPSLTNSLVTRHRIVKCARDYFDGENFIEIETPMLCRSTPEGARDYLVPSRVQPGKFFCLPQSPQQYKQLLMISGLDRYLQIVKCFRDEDLRADRQPEFTQIDLEMSFADEDDIIAVNEGFLKKLFKDILDVDIQLPLRRMPYDEAMNRYGSDKPDLRFELELVDISEHVKNSEFSVFKSAIEEGGSVRAINAKGLAGKLTRKEIDKLGQFVKSYKAKGLAYTRITEEAVASSFEKFLSESEVAAVRSAMNAEVGDVILVVADSKNNVVFDSLGALRCEVAKKFGLIDPGRFELLWVVDFPLFEYSEEDGRFYAKHHPFTSPKDGDLEKLETDQASCYAKAYDIIINGSEAGGGSVRISNPETQKKMFRALGFTDERAKSQFGYLIDAYKYGAPPHAGLAYGLDRLVMLLMGKESIREVIAFPKVQNSSELMTGAPSEVDPAQLDELSIAIDIKE